MMRYALVLLAFTGCGPKAPPTPAAPEVVASVEAPGKTAAELVQEGVAALRAARTDADLKGAEGLLRAALDQDPALVAARYNLGVVLLQRRLRSEAEAAWTQVVREEPTHTAARTALAYSQAAAGRTAEAVRLLRDGLEAQPTAMELHIGLVHCLRVSGDFAGAVAAAQAGLKVQARSIEMYDALGRVYVDQRQYPLARFVYLKALASIGGADQDATVHQGLGRVYQLEGQALAARASFLKALELDPARVEAQLYLSELLMADRNYVDVVPLLEAVTSRYPENKEAWLSLGVAYRGAGKLTEAQAAYARVLELDSSDSRPVFNLGVLQADFLKDYDAALASFAKYKSMGGAEAALADAYVKDIDREVKRVEKRRKAEEERRKRDEERAERQRILEEEKRKAAAGTPDVAPTETPTEGAPPEAGPPVDSPPSEPTPAEPPAPEVPTGEGLPAEGAPAAPAPSAPEEPTPEGGASSPWGEEG